MSPGLDDELGDVVHLDPDAALEAAADQDLGAAPGRGVDPGAEGGPGPDARPDPVDAGDEDVVPAVLRGVVSAAVAWNNAQSGQASDGQRGTEKNARRNSVEQP